MALFDDGNTFTCVILVILPTQPFNSTKYAAWFNQKIALMLLLNCWEDATRLLHTGMLGIVVQIFKGNPSPVQ